MSATMNYSSKCTPIVLDQQLKDTVNKMQNRLAVSYGSLGGKSIPRVLNIVLWGTVQHELNGKNIVCQKIFLIYYPPEIKNSQEMLSYWVEYTSKIGDPAFLKEPAQYLHVELTRHYLVFKSKTDVQVLDLNTTNEVMRINYGQAQFKKADSYVMKFIATSANNVESEFLVVSDNVIKSPSHSKITELTEDQYLAIQRDKLFKRS